MNVCVCVGVVHAFRFVFVCVAGHAKCSRLFIHYSFAIAVFDVFQVFGNTECVWIARFFRNRLAIVQISNLVFIFHDITL